MDWKNMKNLITKILNKKIVFTNKPKLSTMSRGYTGFTINS